MRRALGLLLYLATSLMTALPLAAQTGGPPQRARFVGPDWLIGDGVLRCKVDDQWQLVISVTDAKLQRADLEKFRPEMRSTNEAVAVGSVDENPESTQVLCAGDGRAEVTLKVGDVTLCIPVLVGSEKESAASPCANGFKLSGVATTRTNQTRTTPAPMTAPPAQAVKTPAPTNRAPVDRLPASKATAEADTAPKTATAVQAPLAPQQAEVGVVVVPATDLKAFSGTSGILLRWKPAPGAYGYKIMRKIPPSQQEVALNTQTTDTMFTDGAVSGNSIHVYRLVTLFKQPDGTFASPPASAEATTYATPQSQLGGRGLRTDYTRGMPNVTVFFYTATPRDPSASYTLMRATSPSVGVFTSLPANHRALPPAGNLDVSAFDDTNVAPGKYVYMVRTRLGNGTVIDSDQLTVDVVTPPRGIEPVVVSAPAAWMLRLTWANDPEAIGYRVDYVNTAYSANMGSQDLGAGATQADFKIGVTGAYVVTVTPKYPAGTYGQPIKKTGYVHN